MARALRAKSRACRLVMRPTSLSVGHDSSLGSRAAVGGQAGTAGVAADLSRFDVWQQTPRNDELIISDLRLFSGATASAENKLKC